MRTVCVGSSKLILCIISLQFPLTQNATHFEFRQFAAFRVPHAVKHASYNSILIVRLKGTLGSKFYISFICSTISISKILITICIT